MGFWESVAEGIATAAAMQQAKFEVHQLVNYRVDRAKVAVDRLVTATHRNSDLLGAVLDAFGEQLQAAETQEFQNDVNDLLWYFKASFMSRRTPSDLTTTA